MNYDTDINWSLFRNQIDLFYNDKPILLKNFIPNPEKLASWVDVEISLNNPHTHWELIENHFKINIPTNPTRWGGPRQDKRFIQNHIIQGKTFVIQQYSLQNNYTKLFCQKLEDLFPIVTDMHLYGSKSGTTSSFSPHFDFPANIIIPTYGECEFKVFSNSISILLEQTNHSPDITKLTPIIETTLSPGDMLYIPSRFYHVAQPNEPRLSVSIPCYPGITERWDKNYYKL